MSETRKLTAADLKVGDKVTSTLPSGKKGEGVIGVAASPFSVLDDGRRVRPGSCTIVG